MLYVNVSKKRQLVCSKRVKKWVAYKESVDISATDMKFNGSVKSALMPKTEFDKLVEAKKAKKVAKAKKATKVKKAVKPKKATKAQKKS